MQTGKRFLFSLPHPQSFTYQPLATCAQKKKKKSNLSNDRCSGRTLRQEPPPRLQARAHTQLSSRGHWGSVDTGGPRPSLPLPESSGRPRAPLKSPHPRGNGSSPGRILRVAVRKTVPLLLDCTDSSSPARVQDWQPDPRHTRLQRVTVSTTGLRRRCL